jgi:hypothetical protein
MCITARCGCVEAKVKVNRPCWDDVYRLYKEKGGGPERTRYQTKSLLFLGGQSRSVAMSDASLVFRALIDAPRWHKGDNLLSSIRDAKELKDWLSEKSVWGKEDEKKSIDNNYGIHTVREYVISGRDGVCIIIRGDRTVPDQAGLWDGESEDIVDGNINIYKGDTVYFWELKGIMDCGENWIWSRGDKVFWMVGKYKNTAGNPYYTSNAYSGFLDKKNGMDYRVSKYQPNKDKGPTVEGEYTLNLKPDPARIATFLEMAYGEEDLARNKEGGIEQIPKFPEEYREGWGNERVRLEQNKVSQPKGGHRELDSFYFHDSKKEFTHGCTEVESRFFKILKKHRNKMRKRHGNMKIRVLVKYLGSDHKTRRSHENN